MFAKIWLIPEYGQVLAMRGVDDSTGEPELRWFMEPPDFGVCSFALKFADTEDGWAAAEKAFADADEAAAEKTARSMMNGAWVSPEPVLTQSQPSPRP